MTGKSCPCANGTPARSRPRPAPSCPRRGTPARTPGAATPAYSTACSQRSAPAARWPRSAGRRWPGCWSTSGAAGPGDLEPQPRRRGRLAVLVRRQPAARPGPAGQRRTAPRAPRRHPRGTPPGDRPGAEPARRSAAGEDPVADAVRDRRPGRQRGAGTDHRRPRPGRPPRPGPVQGRRHRMDLLGLRRRPPPRTCARRLDRPGSATTAPGSCSPGTPGGSCTSFATPQRLTSASKASRCS